MQRACFLGSLCFHLPCFDGNTFKSFVNNAPTLQTSADSGDAGVVGCAEEVSTANASSRFEVLWHLRARVKSTTQ